MSVKKGGLWCCNFTTAATFTSNDYDLYLSMCASTSNISSVELEVAITNCGSWCWQHGRLSMLTRIELKAKQQTRRLSSYYPNITQSNPKFREISNTFIVKGRGLLISSEFMLQNYLIRSVQLCSRGLSETKATESDYISMRCPLSGYYLLLWHNKTFIMICRLYRDTPFLESISLYKIKLDVASRHKGCGLPFIFTYHYKSVTGYLNLMLWLIALWHPLRVMPPTY